MASESNCPCIVATSTIFVFATPQVQTAANNVYEYVTAYNNATTNSSKNVKYQFKTDFERMQYIIGRQGRVCNPPTTGS
jgi:hypothetical protein